MRTALISRQIGRTLEFSRDFLHEGDRLTLRGAKTEAKTASSVQEAIGCKAQPTTARSSRSVTSVRVRSIAVICRDNRRRQHLAGAFMIDVIAADESAANCASPVLMARSARGDSYSTCLVDASESITRSDDASRRQDE